MHPFAIDTAGHMYVDMGTATNSCQPENRSLESPGASPCTELKTRGGIWRFDANKTDQKFSPAERYATGIRNAEGFAIDSAGRLFRHSARPRPAALRIGRLSIGSSRRRRSRRKSCCMSCREEITAGRNATSIRGETNWCLRRSTAATASASACAPSKLGAHRGFSGTLGARTAWPFTTRRNSPPATMAVYSSHFTARGTGRPTRRRGYNVVFQALAGDKASGSCEIFADGFAGAEKSPDKAAHRPTGVAVGPDGALYVSDDVRGRIYRIVYRGGPVRGPTHRALSERLGPCRNSRCRRGEPPGRDTRGCRHPRPGQLARSRKAPRSTWWSSAAAYTTAKWVERLARVATGRPATGSSLGPT